MKALIVASRFPLPPHTGDRLRTLIWLDALQSRAEVTLVCPGGDLARTGVRHVAVKRYPAAFISSFLRVVGSGLPLHALIAASHDWRRALRTAGSDFDVAIVLLSRLDPWVFKGIQAPRKILDAIDSLAMSVAERGRQARGPMRLFWKSEVARTARLERAAARRYDRIVVVSEGEREFFGADTIAVPNGIEILPQRAAAPVFDFGFWGRLSYFANRDAAEVLLHRLWPEVRRRCPKATLYVGGADAPAFVQRFNGTDGVSVESPMTDRAQALRRIRTAIFPIRFGTGQSNKILEAAEAGCAILSTPAGARGLAEIAGASMIREEEDLVEGACALYNDPNRVRRMGEQLRELVVRNYDRTSSLDRLASIALSGRLAE